MSVKINYRRIDNKDDKITNNDDRRCKEETKDTDKKQKLLSGIINYFFDSAERNNLDNKKVNKVVKEVQYLFKKDPKRRDKTCFVCEKS